MSSKPNYSKINIKIKPPRNKNISTKNQIKTDRPPKNKRETGFQPKKPLNVNEQNKKIKKIDTKILPPKLSFRNIRKGSVDSIKKRKNIILEEEGRNALKKEIKEEIQDSIIKQIKDSENRIISNIVSNIVSSLNNGFSFLGSIFNKSYDEFLKNKAKDINEAKNINFFDINYNSPNTESFKISQNNNSYIYKGVYLKTDWRHQ